MVEGRDVELHPNVQIRLIWPVKPAKEDDGFDCQGGECSMLENKLFLKDTAILLTEGWKATEHQVLGLRTTVEI